MEKHSGQWQVNHFEIMNLIKAIPLKPSLGSIVSSVSQVMKALEPSTKDLIKA